jgi:hypothetical protein
MKLLDIGQGEFNHIAKSTELEKFLKFCVYVLPGQILITGHLHKSHFGCIDTTLNTFLDN